MARTRLIKNPENDGRILCEPQKTGQQGFLVGLKNAQNIENHKASGNAYCFLINYNDWATLSCRLDL